MLLNFRNATSYNQNYETNKEIIEVELTSKSKKEINTTCLTIFADSRDRKLETM